MTYSYVSSGACLTKAGANINTLFNGILADSEIRTFTDRAEGYLNAATRYDWVAASNAINTSYPNFKPAVAEVIASLTAIDMITYDMEAVGKLEAQNRINVLFDRVEKTLQYLKEIKKPEVSI
jgi:hypothetical protein